MSYFAVDDDFALHPKVVACDSNQAIGLWVRAGAWCQKYLTDGFVPDGTIAMLGGSEADTATLCRARLWARVEGGFVFHEWTPRQGRRDDILARRRADSARKQRGFRPDSTRNDAGIGTDSLRPTPTPTLTERERDLNLPTPLPTLTGNARAHNTNGGGELLEQAPLERQEPRAQQAFEWLHGILHDVLQQPAPRLSGRWRAAYSYIGAQPAAEWLRAEACLRSELASRRLSGRQCTPGHVADYWHSYATGEPPGGGKARARGPSGVGTQDEHDAELVLEEPLP